MPAWEIAYAARKEWENLIKQKKRVISDDPTVGEITKCIIDYDFKNEKSGSAFDPNQIINNSPNNSGIQKLPPMDSIYFNERILIFLNVTKSP